MSIPQADTPSHGQGLDRYLAVSVDPLLPTSLISPDTQAQLHQMARQIPGGLTEFFGFESRLAETDGLVDFLVCIKADTPGRDVLAAAPAADRAPSLPLGAVWDDVRALAQTWRKPGTSLDRHIQNLWLEFDLPAASGGQPSALRTEAQQPALPLPSLFIGSNALLGGQDAPSWLLDEALPLCRGDTTPAALEAALNRALRQLPHHAHIFQLGMMRSRPALENALRVCLRGLSQHEASAYIAALGWSGQASSLDAIWRWASESALQIDADIDLLPQIGPKIGLECSFGWDRDASSRLERFLAALVERGLCTEAKRQGLLDWTRAFHQRAQPDLWPEELVSQAASHESPAVSMFIRSVYHIKLVIQPDRPIEAKAYLAVFHRWMTAELMQHVKSHSQVGRSTA